VTKLDIPAQVIVIVTRTPTRSPTTRAPTALFADFKSLSPEATQILGGAGGGAALLLLVVFICCKRAKNKKLREVRSVKARAGHRRLDLRTSAPELAQEKQRRLEEDMQSIAPVRARSVPAYFASTTKLKRVPEQHMPHGLAFVNCRACSAFPIRMHGSPTHRKAMPRSL
jgi:hypothetical protein